MGRARNWLLYLFLSSKSAPLLSGALDISNRFKKRPGAPRSGKSLGLSVANQRHPPKLVRAPRRLNSGRTRRHLVQDPTAVDRRDRISHPVQNIERKTYIGRRVRIHAIRQGDGFRKSAVLDGPILRVCCRYLVELTLARISYEADGSAGLHNDRNRLTRGSGRSANAVRGRGATAQRGHRGLERGDESAAIGALRSIISCLPGRGGDTQLRK